MEGALWESVLIIKNGRFQLK